MENFVHMITRSDYGWGASTKMSINLGHTLSPYFSYLITYVSPLVVVFTLLGLVYLIAKKKGATLLFHLLLSIFLGLIFLIFASGSIIKTLYRMSIIERFYSQSIITFFYFYSFGFLSLIEGAEKLLNNGKLKNSVVTIIYFTILIIPATFFLSNFPKVNFNSVYIGDNFGKDLLEPLPAGSAVFFQDDNRTFNSLYVQLAYNVRPDIYIPGRHDGFIEIIKAAGYSDKEAHDYALKWKTKIDNELFYQSLPTFLEERDVYSDFFFENIEINDIEKGKLLFIPYGIVYKLYFEKDFTLSKEDYIKEVENITIHHSTDEFAKNQVLLNNNLIYTKIKSSYSQGYLAIADFIVNYYGDRDEAKKYLQKAIDVNSLTNKD